MVIHKYGIDDNREISKGKPWVLQQRGFGEGRGKKGKKLSNDDILDIRYHGIDQGYAYNIAIARIQENGIFKDITYYQSPDNPNDWGSEIYQGKNYIEYSEDPSFSRNYKNGEGLPEKYKDIVSTLKKMHEDRYGEEEIEEEVEPEIGDYVRIASHLVEAGGKSGEVVEKHGSFLVVDVDGKYFSVHASDTDIVDDDELMDEMEEEVYQDEILQELDQQNMITGLKNKFPTLELGTTEEFGTSAGGIWVKNNPDMPDGIPMFDSYANNSLYPLGVHKDVNQILTDHGWHAEWHDAGTVMFWQ